MFLECLTHEGKTFEGLLFNVFVKFFAPHLSEGYTSTKGGGVAQTDATRASPGESN
jgi:hypothetical protein